MTKTILVMVGSIRKDSFNKTLAHKIENQLNKNNMNVTFAKIDDLPMMNQDIEFPAPLEVERLRKSVKGSDALWIVSPEYNGTIPGVLKNALDWLSRPTQPRTFGAPEFITNKPVTISGAGGKNSATGGIMDLIKLVDFMGMNPMKKTVGLQIPTDAFMSNSFDLTPLQKGEISEQVNDFKSFLNEEVNYEKTI